MKIKLTWRSALGLPLPAIMSTTCWLITRHLVSGTAWPLSVAGLAGLLSLAALAVMEHEETRRAGLPYKAEHLLARAEARNRMRYAKAQTRRVGRRPSAEGYSPDSATDLAEIMRMARSREITE